MENKDFNTEKENTTPLSSEDNALNLSDAKIVSEAKAASSEEPAKKEFNLKKEIREWVVAIVVALIAVFIIKTFLFDIVRVDGRSMNPTLAHGEHLILRKIGYEPQRGDIIVFDSKYKERHALAEGLDSGFDKFLLEHEYFTQKKNGLSPVPYIKRVIALPGDKVSINDDGCVYVNGELIEENYIQGVTENTMMLNKNYTVEEGHVFVMGDNREHGGSRDSRDPTLGTIPYEAIMGKASVRIWPLNAIGSPY